MSKTIKTLKIVEVQCIKPSSGVDDAGRVIAGIVGAIGGGVAAGAGTAATGGALVATVGIGIVGGAGVGVLVLETIDHFISGGDELYIKVDDTKVWPREKYKSIDSQETVAVDYSTPFDEKVTIALMEWDLISKDDKLHVIEVYPERMNPNNYGFQEMLLANEDEGSSYKVTLQITSDPEISISKPNAIPYGTKYGVGPLNPTSSVPGTFTFPDASPTLLTPGKHTIKVTFTPDDHEKYNAVTQDMTITISKAMPEIVWASPESIVQDTPLGEKQLNATAWVNVGGQKVEVKGNAIYFWHNQVITPGMKLPAGLHTLSVRIEPNSEASANFEAAIGNVQLRVWTAEEVLNDGKDQTFSHLALKYYGHATPHYWQWIIDANKGNIPADYKKTRPGSKIFIPEKPPAPGSQITKKELVLVEKKAEVTATSLEVREVPDENGRNLMYLKKGDKITVNALWTNEAGDLWGRLSENEWCAIKYEGKPFMNILED